MAGVGVIFEGGWNGDLSVRELTGGHLEFEVVDASTFGSGVRDVSAVEPVGVGDVERLADALDEWLRARGVRR